MGTAVAVAGSRAISREKMERWFYLLSSVVFLVIVALGFQQFYRHGRAVGGTPVTPQITALVFLHGIAMYSWFILLIVESGLIVRGNR
jgi:hypothetical protein